MKKHLRETLKLIESYGIEISKVINSKHIKLKLLYHGKTHTITISRSPSDHRIKEKIKKDCRKIVNQ